MSINAPENKARTRAFLEERGAPFPTYITHTDEPSKTLRMMDSTWTGAIPATPTLSAQGGKSVITRGGYLTPR